MHEAGFCALQPILFLGERLSFLFSFFFLLFLFLNCFILLGGAFCFLFFPLFTSCWRGPPPPARWCGSDSHLCVRSMVFFFPPRVFVARVPHFRASGCEGRRRRVRKGGYL
ncbi:hypothetical protein TRSC58_07652 [Trypanosoma rangeli SC58]|uniref:Uncharacterized protein n=1 Tax=Trypanosoma rangeli SC58 TaxID=429131 RepID=A0A061IRQ7_TRYRA|nr:hypothetical protein TRSC58_07652 [Trypanosoma rangeli SC58]